MHPRALAFASLLCLTPTAAAQVLDSFDFGSGAVVVPQQRVYALAPAAGGIRLRGVLARARIDGHIATTTLQLQILNEGALRAEARLLLPLPAGAVVRGFRFEGLVDGPTARLLPRDEARALYESIVQRVRDPALLEMAGCAALQSSVFPVEPGGTQAVLVTWDQVLAERDGRLEYALPRSELSGAAAVPWRIAVELRGATSVGTAWSPTHELQRARLADDRLLVTTRDADVLQPGPFQLTWTVARPGQLSATLLAHPDPPPGADRSVPRGGHLALLAGLPAMLPAEWDVAAAGPDPQVLGAAFSREVTLVLDRSGSMRGDKWEQSLEAARQVLAGLTDGEALNVIDYADSVERFAPAPAVVDADCREAVARYLDGLSVGGGTNLHGALLAAVGQPAGDERLPVVLFLTDGLPTVGVRDERRIRDEVAAANAASRRLFTFGVGADVNAPLLDALAASSRALSTYVLPGQDVEVAVGQVARRLHGPLLAEPLLEAFDMAGAPAPHALRELQPATLPDLYAEDQLLVLGRWLGEAPLRLRLSGRSAAGPWSTEWSFDPRSASAEHAALPRLWAARRIAALVDEVRQSAPDGVAPGGAGSDPRLDELVQEIVLLSTQHGILTEYTAFLATEGSVLGDDTALRQRVRKLLSERGRQTRTGRGAVGQAVNLRRLAAAGRVDKAQRHLVEQGGALVSVGIDGVRHVHDLTFFRAGGDRWVDARLIQRVRAGLAQLAAGAALAAGAPDAELAGAAAGDGMLAVTVVRPGTPEHAALVAALEREGRQGVLALGGQVLLELNGRPVLLHPPPVDAAPPADGP